MSRNILMFGASQRTGLEVARRLTARGDRVIAFVRPTSDRSELDKLGVHYAVGDVRDAAAVNRAFQQPDIDAVICTFGGARGDAPRPDAIGVRHVVNAAQAAGVMRFLIVTVIGAGDSRGAVSDNVMKFLGPVIEAKTEAEAEVTASGLDYTILRPGGMGSGPATGTAVRTEDHSAMGMIQRADLAALLVECLDDQSTIGRIYHAIDPKATEVPPLQRGDAMQQGPKS